MANLSTCSGQISSSVSTNLNQPNKIGKIVQNVFHQDSALSDVYEKLKKDNERWKNLYLAEVKKTLNL